jgi:cell division protease FtsH
MFNTRGRMRQEIIVDLGGRAAEELIFEDITTGASQDIKVATKTARAMVTLYGFSDAIGMVNYDNDDDEVFIGRDLAHTRSYSENIANRIDDEVRAIIDDCYKEAKKVLVEYKNILESCADLLIQKERITREEFEALFPTVTTA